MTYRLPKSVMSTREFNRYERAETGHKRGKQADIRQLRLQLNRVELSSFMQKRMFK